MALALKLKLKTGLKQQIEQEDKKGGNDPRFLNFYDLKDNEKMEILFVPDVNGELWAKFKKHGPNLKVRGTGAIRCAYESSGDNCPACKQGFEYLDIAKETNDKAYKDEAKKWFAREYTLMSCIVLDAPMEILESPDHNQVKLIYVPYAIESKIKESITEGVLDENELCQTPFFIKKTKNGGGYADYSTSYFGRKEVTEDQLAFFEDKKVEQFDYNDLDVIPKATTEAEVAEWLEKAIAAVDAAANGATEEAPKGRQETRQEPRQETRRPAPAKADPEPDMTEEERNMGEAQEEEAPEEPKKTTSSLRDRLSRLK